MNRVSSIVFLGTALAYMFFIDVHCTPRDAYFWGNLAIWWMPQVFVLCVALLFKPPLGLLGGVALAYGTFALLAHAWGSLMMSWAGYWICMLGACTGVVVAAIRAMIRTAPRAETAAIDGFCCVGVGVAINVLILRILFH
jgi:hypothetical protein